MRHPSCPLCRGAYDRLPKYRLVELVRCRACGVIFSPHIPSAEDLAEHYAGYNRDHSSDNAPSIARREELLDRFEPYRKLGRMLDVGCGVGFLLDQARARGWETFGVEYTEEAVEVCASHGHHMHQGALQTAPLEPGTFDVVIYTEVIEHIYNQPEEFERVHELMRPSGLLYITTPNIDSLSFRVLGDAWPVVQYPEHLVYFSPKTLDDFMRRARFEPVWMEATGLSPSQLVAGLRDAVRTRVEPPPSDDEPVMTNTHGRKATFDNALRTAITKSRALTVALDGVNAFLTATSLGDAIKAGYEKR
ncbi:MAG: class I SAM-dependent methyltransferase [Myxococcales bacterium]|nr:class I SAM-dependent methyltransferase [Myxococcales bacterium]